MKRILNFLSFVILCLFCNSAKGQTTKEVLIIGTMHTVPKITKNSYRPMLEKAKSYAPNAIYVETAMPDDSLSWAYLKDGYSSTLQKVYIISDSLKNAADYHYDEDMLNQLLKKNKLDLSDDEMKKMCTAFLYLRDYPNYYYHKYIRQYGKAKKKKASREENWDLSSPLALHLGHKKIFACDDQQTNALYIAYSEKCENFSKENEKAIKRASSKFIKKGIFPILFGRMGDYANRSSSAEQLHRLSSLQCIESPCDDCELANRYWDERNQRIVKKLGNSNCKPAIHEKCVSYWSSSYCRSKGRIRKTISRN